MKRVKIGRSNHLYFSRDWDLIQEIGALKKMSLSEQLCLRRDCEEEFHSSCVITVIRKKADLNWV
jgi:hypothetical protein